MKNLFQFKNGLLYLSMLLIMFSSCAPVFYSPGTQIQTDLHKKNDVTISVAHSQGNDDHNTLGDENPGIDCSIAYAPINNVGLVLNRNSFSDGFSSFVSTRGLFAGDWINHHSEYKMTNLGAGYFTDINEVWSQEAYLLVGRGALKTHSSNADFHLNAKVKRVGLQYNLNYKKNWFTMGVLNNLSQLSYSDIDGILPNGKDLNLRANATNVIFETALAIGVGFDQLKVQWQIGRSNNLNNKDFLQNDSYTSMGVQFNIGEILKAVKIK